MCRKQSGIAIGRLCDKCDGKCPVCDSYVRPSTLVRICDECSFGNFQNKCVVCGGEVRRAFLALGVSWSFLRLLTVSNRVYQMPSIALNAQDSKRIATDVRRLSTWARVGRICSTRRKASETISRHEHSFIIYFEYRPKYMALVTNLSAQKQGRTSQEMLLVGDWNV